MACHAVVEMWGTPREHEQEVHEEIQVLESFTLLDAVSAVLAAAIDRTSGTAAAASAWGYESKPF